MANYISRALTAFIIKRSRMLALTVTLALGLSGAAAQTLVTVDNIIYTIANGKVTVADNRSSPLPATLVIPSTITVTGSTYDVTGIADTAFHRCTGLTSVTIPSSVETIDDWAFNGCTSLTELFFLRSGSTAFGDGVFYNVPNVAAGTLHYPAGAAANYVPAGFAGGALSNWSFVAVDMTAPKLTEGAGNRSVKAVY